MAQFSSDWYSYNLLGTFFSTSGVDMANCHNTSHFKSCLHHQRAYLNIVILDVYMQQESMPAFKLEDSMHTHQAESLVSNLHNPLNNYNTRYMLAAVQNELPRKDHRPVSASTALPPTVQASEWTWVNKRLWTGNVGDHTAAINMDLTKSRNKPKGECQSLWKKRREKMKTGQNCENRSWTNT